MQRIPAMFPLSACTYQSNQSKCKYLRVIKNRQEASRIAPRVKCCTFEALGHGSHSFRTANTPCPPVTSYRPNQRASPLASGSSHLIAAYYSFIDPERNRMKGWVDLVSWPTADGLPIWFTRHLQVKCRPVVKVRRSKTDVLPLSYTTRPV